METRFAEFENRSLTGKDVHALKLNELKTKVAVGQDMRQISIEQAKYWRSRECTMFNLSLSMTNQG